MDSSTGKLYMLKPPAPGVEPSLRTHGGMVEIPAELAEAARIVQERGLTAWDESHEFTALREWSIAQRKVAEVGPYTVTTAHTRGDETYSRQIAVPDVASIMPRAYGREWSRGSGRQRQTKAEHKRMRKLQKAAKLSRKRNR